MTSPARTDSSLFAVILTLAIAACAVARADSEPDRKPPAEPSAENGQTQAVTSSASSSTGAAASNTTSQPEYPPYSEVLKDFETIDGLIRLHRKGARLYGEISRSNLDRDFLVLISIARGIGETPLLGGMSWGFGDDWLWQFRQVDDRVQIVRRNVRFTAAKGSPEEKAVRLAYTDSVLFSLPIATKGAGGSLVVDLTSVLMSDLPQISTVLRGFSFSKDKSSFASVKGFKDNVEIQVAATYASSGSQEFDTVADSRGVTINVHYSISQLPSTGYKPRVADDRVGYFVTVLKDYSKDTRHDRFVRYINRWDLQKADPSAGLSPPKQPIIFWLEKTVPFKYRKPIREGILEWNKAYEKAGFTNAIEVRQQPDDAEWDPEDVNYNTFRWITSSAGFAMGPSRVNPTTGQILDADIIFDADFLQYWEMEYDVFTPSTVEPGEEDAFGKADPIPRLDGGASDFRRHSGWQCGHCRGMARQLAFGAMTMVAEEPAGSEEEIQKLLMQGLKETAMHEVGHTLGLRHNFKASTMLTLEEINDPEKTAAGGIAASVMDYLPVNRAPQGVAQGDYFSQTIGPYDHWAIEYGYKPFSSNEEAELQKTAARGAEPALNYATDDDARGDDPDPLVNRFDLGKDPIQYARQQVELIGRLWPDLVERITREGEGYQRVRRAFNILLSSHGSAMRVAARFIGGLYAYRDHRGDPQERPPFVVVEPERQREAWTLLEEEVFGVDSYQFPPELYNHLAPSKWTHWGTRETDRPDFPIHEVILTWQDRVLGQLLSPTTLERLLDSELKLPPEADAFTCAELLEGLSTAIFRETEKIQGRKFTNREPAISSLRRSLQRRYLERLSNLAMGNTSAPVDCQSVAYIELEALEARIRKILSGKARLDTYTEAHLKESAARIRKVLEARLQLRAP
jgi:hypothetical protein